MKIHRILRIMFSFSVSFFLFFSPFYNLPVYATSTQTVTHTSLSDFTVGTADTTIDLQRSPGEIKLKRDKSVLESDLQSGYSPAVNTTIQSSGINLNQGYAYNILSFPALADNYVQHSFLDSTTNYLYMSTDGGLSVINLTTNTLVTRFHTGSTPALASNSVYHSLIDSATNRLYVSTWSGGLSVINLTTNTLVTRFHTGSTPALADNRVLHSFLDPTTNRLYVSTSGGLSVINLTTNTLVTRYHTGSTPALANNWVYHSFRDPLTNYLYVSSGGGGLSVINLTTNTLVTRFHTGSTPALADNYVQHSFLDSTSNFLFVSTRRGLSVINLTTNTLVTRFHTGSTPALANRYAWYSFLDPATNYLYVSTWNGLSVINLTTNTLVTRFHTGSTPALADNRVLHSFLDPTTNRLYVSTSGGLSVINLDYQRALTGTHLSQPQSLNTTPTEMLTWEIDLPTNTAAYLTYRTAQTDTAWFDGFYDGDESNISDLYSWGKTFTSVVEEDGVLTLSEPTTPINSWTGFWINTGKPANHFPAGSVVRAKLKVTADLTEYEDYMFTDEWEDGSVLYYTVNEWVYLTLVPTLPFSSIGFEPYWTGTWGEDDIYQLDWISVSMPDSAWSAWSEPCSNQYGCDIDPADLVGKEWIQYRLNLSTTDTSKTPVVTGVTFASGYQANGVYTSVVIDGGSEADWETLAGTADVPVGTAVVYSTRSGNTSTVDSTWSPWQAVSTASAIGSANARYLQYQVTLSTTDENTTPVLHSVTLTYTGVPQPTGVPAPEEKKPEVYATKGNTITKEGMSVTIESDVVPYDVYTDSHVTKKDIPYYLSNLSSWQVSDIHTLYLKSFFNDAVVIETDKPYIISLSYTAEDLIYGDGTHSFSPNSLYLVYKEHADDAEWTRLSSSVVDATNHTVSALTKKGGLCMIVASTIPLSDLNPDTSQDTYTDNGDTSQYTDNTRGIETQPTILPKKVSADTQPTPTITTTAPTPQGQASPKNFIQVIVEWVEGLLRK